MSVKSISQFEQVTSLVDTDIVPVARLTELNLVDRNKKVLASDFAAYVASKNSAGFGTVESIYTSTTQGTNTAYLSNGSSTIYTAGLSGALTVNLTYSGTQTLGVAMAAGKTAKFKVIIQQLPTPYALAALQIDGVTITPRWYNNQTPPTPNAAQVSVYSYDITALGNSQYLVLAKLEQYN